MEIWTPTASNTFSLLDFTDFDIDIADWLNDYYDGAYIYLDTATHQARLENRWQSKKALMKIIYENLKKIHAMDIAKSRTTTRTLDSDTSTTNTTTATNTATRTDSGTSTTDDINLAFDTTNTDPSTRTAVATTESANSTDNSSGTASGTGARDDIETTTTDDVRILDTSGIVDYLMNHTNVYRYFTEIFDPLFIWC